MIRAGHSCNARPVPFAADRSASGQSPDVGGRVRRPAIAESTTFGVGRPALAVPVLPLVPFAAPRYIPETLHAGGSSAAGRPAGPPAGRPLKEPDTRRGTRPSVSDGRHAGRQSAAAGTSPSETRIDTAAPLGHRVRAAAVARSGHVGDVRCDVPVAVCMVFEGPVAEPAWPGRPSHSNGDRLLHDHPSRLAQGLRRPRTG